MGRKRKYDRHLPERLYHRSGSFYFVEHGTGKWINLGRNYVRAIAEYGQLTADESPSHTVGALIDRYLREVAPMKAERSFKDNIRQARYLRAFFGKMSPNSVTQRHIYQYLDQRGKQSQVQANREYALLAHIFKKAVRWGDLLPAENPCVGIEKFKEKPRSRYIEDWEYLAFRNHAGDFIARYMDVKYLTGLRQGDLLALRLDQLKDDGIHFEIKKTGKRIIICWKEDLKAAVEATRKLPRPVRGLYLFCNRRRQPYTGSGFRSIWQRKMRSALEQGVLTERFTEHDLRAKSASDTDPEHATRLLAHSSSKMTETYLRKPERVSPLQKVLEERRNIGKKG